MLWLRSYGLMLRWNVLRLRGMLPFFVVAQAALGVGVIVGYAFLLPAVDTQSATYLATGGVAIGIIMIGLVMSPQTVVQRKQQGAFDFDRTLPVPPTAALLADVSLWSVATLPGLGLALGIGALRFDLDLDVSPLVVPAIALVTLTATAVGYGMAYLLPPMVATVLTQLLAFAVLMFSPIHFPASRLPGWLQAVHDVLPVQYMAQAIRETLAVPAGGVSATPFAVLAVWCVVGLLVTYRLLVRRG